MFVHLGARPLRKPLFQGVHGRQAHVGALLLLDEKALPLQLQLHARQLQLAARPDDNPRGVLGEDRGDHRRGLGSADGQGPDGQAAAILHHDGALELHGQLPGEHALGQIGRVGKLRVHGGEFQGLALPDGLIIQDLCMLHPAGRCRGRPTQAA